MCFLQGHSSCCRRESTTSVFIMLLHWGRSSKCLKKTLSLRVKNKLRLSWRKPISHCGGVWLVCTCVCVCVQVGVGGVWGYGGGMVSPLGRLLEPAARVSDINKLLDTTGWNNSPKSCGSVRGVSLVKSRRKVAAAVRLDWVTSKIPCGGSWQRRTGEILGGVAAV